MTTNMSTMVMRGRTRMPKAFSTPIRIAARSAPHTEPIPPMTTTTKASTITVVSMTVVTATRGTWSAPASPARNEPSTNTEVNRRDWSTPSAATISRSWVAARMSTPHRVRWKSAHSPSATTGPAPIMARS